jgi:hypothetical protein
VAKPTSFRPNKRAYQKSSPGKGADFPATSTTTPSAPERTAAWPAPDKTGNSQKRLRGIARVKTRMMERT